jgi:hypothetical protein
LLYTVYKRGELTLKNSLVVSHASYEGAHVVNVWTFIYKSTAVHTATVRNFEFASDKTDLDEISI